MPRDPQQQENWWQAVLGSKALAQDLIFFLTVILILAVMYLAVDRLTVNDQDREELLGLHYKIALAAVAMMGAKLLLHLVHSPEGEEEE